MHDDQYIYSTTMSCYIMVNWLYKVHITLVPYHGHGSCAMRSIGHQHRYTLTTRLNIPFYRLSAGL